jgi:hypothetical protein
MSDTGNHSSSNAVHNVPNGTMKQQEPGDTIFGASSNRVHVNTQSNGKFSTIYNHDLL